MAPNTELGTGNTYKPADMEFRDDEDGECSQANHNDSGYHSWSLENFPSIHFDDAFQVEDHDLEIDPSFEAGLLSGNFFRPPSASHTAPAILSRQRPVNHMGELHLPGSLLGSQIDTALIPGYESTPRTQHSVPRGDPKGSAVNTLSAGSATHFPSEFDSNASPNMSQKSLEVGQIGHDSEITISGATGPNSKAIAIIRTWIEVSPEQLPSAEDITYFSSFAKLPPAEINKIFLGILAEKAIKGSRGSKGAATNDIKPLVPNVPSSRSQRVVLANSDALLRAAEWVSQQITICKTPIEHSVMAQSKRPRVSYPCSFCRRIFSTKDTWRRHEELRCPQEGWLCNLDTIVQIGQSSQCTHCNAEDPDMDHFHIEHPEYTKSGPCCRQPFSRRVFKRRDVFVSHLEKVHPSIPLRLHNEIVARSHFAVPTTFDENCTICRSPESYKFRDWEDRITHLAQHFKKMAPGQPERDRHDKDDEGKDESDEEDDDTDPKPLRKRVRKSQLNWSGNTADKKVWLEATSCKNPTKFGRTSSPGTVSDRQVHPELFSSALKEQLANASVEWPPSSTNCFIPQDTFKHLLKRHAVLDELEHSLGDDYLALGEKRYEIVDFVMERAAKLFAILTLIGKCKSILDFMVEGISDIDLPFQLSNTQSSENLLASHNSARTNRIFTEWSNWDLQELSRFQWSLLAPVFELGHNSKHYDFQSNSILPFVGDEEGSRKTGGYGSVWRVKIHPAHQRWNGDLETEKLGRHQVAIKKLHSADKRSFELERDALKALNFRTSSHLVKLLATYTFKGHYHFIFPWADGTLRSYWQRVREPRLVPDQEEYVLWMAEQFKGLAHALFMLHEYRTDGVDRYGRHGDLKPENILWFKDQESGDSEATTNGLLAIADFGLTRFHKEESRSNVDPASIAGSPTYRPPECDLRLPVSRAYDIWSLGCVFLEFITWYIYGSQGVENFERARSVDTGGTRDFKFYTILGYKHSNRRSAILRPSVTQWIEQLRENPSSTSYIKDLLTLVQYSLLVPDPKHRMRAKDIVAELSKMLERSRSDSGYISLTGKRAPESTVPFARDPKFIGRQDVFADLELRLFQTNSHSRAVLVGLGGVGKSQIAIEYSYQRRERDPDLWVFWVYASTAERFEGAYRSIAATLGLPGTDDPKTDVLGLVFRWLSNTGNGRWLMILDNADDVDVFRKTQDRSAKENSPNLPLSSYIPQSITGSVLVTTRDRGATSWLSTGYTSVIPVNLMELKEAQQLLQINVPEDISNSSDRAELVKELDYLPLAISQAAAYISANPDLMSVSEYLMLYRQDEESQSRLLDKDSGDLRRDLSVPNSVIRTWQISFDLIERNQPQAAELLSLMAMLDCQGIPEFLLNVQYPKPLDLKDALSPLNGFSLITIEKGGKTFGMHRLVQLATRKWVEQYGDSRIWRGKAINVVSTAFPNGSYGNWKTCEALSPHALQVLTYGLESNQCMLDRASLLHNMAWYNWIQGRYEVAKAESQESLTLRKIVLKYNDRRTLASMGMLASVLSSQGKYADAEAMNRQTLEIREEVLGKTHPETLTSVHNLAYVLQNRHEYEEALILYQRACTGFELSLSPEHPTTKACLEHYSDMLQSLEEAK